jgi:quercetin dioxygenase-like cupin family protein
MVEYSPGYLADHWCDKGHILLVLEGSITTEFKDGSRVVVHAGESYQVADDTRAHRSSTAEGASLFIVD